MPEWWNQADTDVSKASVRKDVRVRVPLPAPRAQSIRLSAAPTTMSLCTRARLLSWRGSYPASGLWIAKTLRYAESRSPRSGTGAGVAVADPARKDAAKFRAAPDVMGANSMRALIAISWAFTWVMVTSLEAGETSTRCRSNAVTHGRVSRTRQELPCRRSCPPPGCSPSPGSGAPRSRAPQSTGRVCFRSMGRAGNTSAKSSLNRGSRRSLTATQAISLAACFIRTAAALSTGSGAR
jgi:hypothetical protein